MKNVKAETVIRAYATVCNKETVVTINPKDRTIEIDWDHGNTGHNRVFVASPVVGDPDHYVCLEYAADSTGNREWNCDIVSNYYFATLNEPTANDYVQFAEDLLTNFFELERAYKIFQKLKKADLIK